MNSIFNRSMVTLRRIVRHSKWVLFGENNADQLELFLPPNLIKRINYIVPENYYLRTYNFNDQSEIISLMRVAGFTDWDLNTLYQAMYLCLPDGYFVLIEKKSRKIIATMMARHISDYLHPFGGRIDWLAVNPNYTGKGLGYVVAAAATDRLIEVNYRNIYVTTDDHRLGAIKIFIKIGFVPNLYRHDMYDRWKSIYKCFGQPFQPEQWDKLKNELMNNNKYI